MPPPVVRSSTRGRHLALPRTDPGPARPSSPDRPNSRPARSHHRIRRRCGRSTAPGELQSSGPTGCDTAVCAISVPQPSKSGEGGKSNRAPQLEVENRYNRASTCAQGAQRRRHLPAKSQALAITIKRRLPKAHVGALQRLSPAGQRSSLWEGRAAVRLSSRQWLTICSRDSEADQSSLHRLTPLLACFHSLDPIFSRFVSDCHE